MTKDATITVGSGTAAQTLRVTTASDGETVVVIGTVGSQLASTSSETIGIVQFTFATGSPSEFEANGSAASGYAVSGSAVGGQSTGGTGTAKGQASVVALSAAIMLVLCSLSIV